MIASKNVKYLRVNLIKQGPGSGNTVLLRYKFSQNQSINLVYLKSKFQQASLYNLTKLPPNLYGNEKDLV